MLRVVIVDDEPLAREGLRIRLAREGDIEVVCESAGGEHAVATIVHERPDLVFLDVQMPELDGFTVLERASGEWLPEVVFVTAFDRHALRAFEVHALDYLLKPLTDERFADALAHARARLAAGDANPVPQRLGQMLDARARGSAGAGYLERLAVPYRGRFVLIPVNDVEWFAAAANYVEVHVAEESYLVRSTLRDLEAHLDPARFARIHRSTIVNLERVREIMPEVDGDFEVVLHGGQRLAMSRGRRHRLMPRRRRERDGGASPSDVDSY